MKRISFKDSQGLKLTQMVLMGRKTMMRRVVKLPDYWDPHDANLDVLRVRNSYIYFLENIEENEHIRIYPKYFPGEIVAIQQAYKDVLACEHLSDEQEDEVCRLVSKGVPGCTNKMFVRADLMPHHIRITDARCEWLTDIYDTDCMREGVIKARNCRGVMYVYDWSIDQDGDILANRWYQTPREAFADLIDKVSGRGTWERDPIVWVYEFELVD